MSSMINEKLSFILNPVINKLNAISPAFIKRLSDLFWIKTAKFQRSMKNSGLALRLYSLKDLPALHSLFNLEILLRANGARHRAFSSLLLFCKWMITSFQVFYLIENWENDGGRIVGFVGLYNIKIGKTLFLSIGIFKPEDRGRGYGKKSIELLLDSLKKYSVVETVCVEILKTNVASLSFFKKLGFEVYRQYKDRFLLEKHIEKRSRR